MPANKSTQKNFDGYLKFLLYFGFFLIGITTVLIGQILPILSARLALPDEQSGYFFVAQFGASLAATLAANSFVRRVGFAFVLLIGFALAALGALLLNVDSLSACLAAFVFIGVGIGLTIPSINLLTVRINPKKTSSALNRINFLWGFGAILCKPLIDFFRGGGNDILTSTSALAASLLLVGLAVGFLPTTATRKAQNNENRNKSHAPVWTTATAWLIAAFNFLHVGLETGIGGWITTYAARLSFANGNSFEWLSAASLFFLFLVVGRGVAPLLLRLLSDNALLLSGLLTLLIGIVILLAAHDLRILQVGAAIAGLGSSAIFPTNMSRFMKIFGAENATRRATPLFVAGSLGGALTSYLIGFVSGKFNDLRVGMFVLFAGGAILIVLQIVLSTSYFVEETESKEAV